MNIHQRLHEPGFAGRHGRSALRIAGLAVGGVAFAAFFAFLFGIVVKLLWNWLMPALFGLGTITFWQAFGIVLLAKILFGGHGHGSREHDRSFERRFRDRFKKPAGAGEDAADDGPVPGDGKQWRQFRRFWQEEGKSAFEAYLRKMEEWEAEKPRPG
ncbi:MAG: hypothetical protein JW747_04575 [Candidatus Aminicenantes bacterium]|nr:hypothetical protein [Candidatus Aminicenantes bacterium]